MPVASHPFFAELDGLLDIINWSQLGKFALPTLALPLIWAIAHFSAKKKVQNRLDDLEGQLKNLNKAAEVAQGKIANLELQIITQAQTIAMQAESVKLKESQLAAKQTERDKIFAEGVKEYQKRMALVKYKSQYESLKAQATEDERRISILEEQLIRAGGDAGKLIEDLRAREIAMTKAESRLRKARKLEGYLWHAKALQRRPKFRPLLDRKAAIVSVLNLKGGVGKTTTVAQLGAAFARRGYRVLCVDLDLQGSLTTQFLDQSLISERFDAKRLLQHFFRYAGDGANPKIADFAQEVPSPPGRAGALHVLPTTDGLAFAEFNLAMGWLLQAGERDARFLLRKALHAKSVAKQFDIVLLDCPPLLNISCINALAASDYLLIPVLPSLKTLERVRNLLEATLSEPFKTHVNQNLNVLGLLANRTHSSGLTQDDHRNFRLILERMKNLFAVELRQFATEIPQLKGIQEGDSILAETKSSPAIEAVYRKLVEEIERIFPHDCRRVAKVLP